MLTDQELLLRHARHPSHAGDVSAFALRGSCKNPFCGDAVDIGVDVVDGVVSRVAIRASGCGISTASASLMTEAVEGMSVASALNALELFNSTLLARAGTPWPSELTALKPFERLRLSPTRVPCALIGWFALKTRFSLKPRSSGSSSQPEGTRGTIPRMPSRELRRIFLELGLLGTRRR